MRPEKDTIFVDETGKAWKRIDWDVKKFDTFRTRDAERVGNIFRGRFLSFIGLTSKTRFSYMPHTSAGSYGISTFGVVLNNGPRWFLRARAHHLGGPFWWAGWGSAVGPRSIIQNHLESRVITRNLFLDRSCRV